MISVDISLINTNNLVLQNYYNKQVIENKDDVIIDVSELPDLPSPAPKPETRMAYIAALIVDIYVSLAAIISQLNKTYYAHTNRLIRNVIRVLVAGLLSMAGGAFAGDPRIVSAVGVLVAVYFGAFLGGFGNMLSTILVLETDTEDRVEDLEKEKEAQKKKTTETDEKVEKLEKQIKDLSEKVMFLSEVVKNVDPKVIVNILKNLDLKQNNTNAEVFNKV